MLLATLNFVSAVGATSSVILLASGDTITLSILALRYRFDSHQEAASIISIILMVMTAGLASLMRAFGLRLGVRHNLGVREAERSVTAAFGLRLAARHDRLSESALKGSVQLAAGGKPEDR
jgi:hypothetical protein